MPRDAIIYTRISRDREGAGLGVERQLEDCRELAEQLGWQVIAHHSDNDLSAYSGKPRPGYAALLADLEAGQAGAVIAWHGDRLHRSPVELEAYIDLCERRGVVTQTVRAGLVDLSTPSGRMVARQLGTVARYEVEHMVERQQRAKLQAATSGRWKGGRRPFGFEADGMTVRPPEAAALRQAADAALSGVSLHQLARDLNGQGVPTSTGRPWRPADLRRTLLRPRNAGLMEHRGEVIGAAQWPAIVPEDTWRAVRALLSDDSRRTSPGSARRWLGSGLYRCGVCGSGLRASTSGTGGKGRGHKPAYRCPTGKHIVRDAAALDGFVESIVIERLRRPDAARLAERPDVDTTALHAEALALRQRLEEIAVLHADGAIDGRQLQAGSARLHRQMEHVEQRIADAASGSVLAGVADATDPAEAWAAADLSRRRAILDTLLAVTAHRGRRGRLPGGGYFDPEAVAVEWKTP